ncbi:SDR family oxidoreductase [Rhodococcus erythropolis]|uniref:SDR family oxidoreductase n=1 Tax=Rhodococcus erythropolis TaxID=1833 RepID=UPI003873B596
MSSRQWSNSHHLQPVCSGRTCGSGTYAASKAVGDQLVRAATQELGPRGITVNSVLPGATRTASFEGSGVPSDVVARQLR